MQEQFRPTIEQNKKPISSFEKIARTIRRKILTGALLIASSLVLGEHPEIVDQTSAVSFNEAFRKSREAGQEEFTWHGRKYTTKLVDKEFSDLYWESKKFLEEYYNSEYFKNKQTYRPSLVDSLDAKIISQEKFKTPRFKELDSRGIPNLSLNELNELVRFYDEQESFRKNVTSSPLFKTVLDSISASKPGPEKLSQERLKALHSPSYFSITTQKGRRGDDGASERLGKKIFISGHNSKDRQTVAVHELSHKSSKHGQDLQIGGWMALKEKAMNLFIRNKLHHELAREGMTSQEIEEWARYMTSPNEIDARQNSTRFWLFKHFPGYRADSMFTAEHFFFLKRNFSQLPYDIQQLLEIFADEKDFIELMNTY